MICIVRHAHAEDAGGRPDRERRLTDRGREAARGVGRALRERGLTPKVVYASPALRAVETAEHLAWALDPSPRIETREGLYGGPGIGALQELLTAESPGGVVVVGHAPDVGLFVQAVSGAEVVFSPATACCLEPGTPAWRPVWIVA